MLEEKMISLELTESARELLFMEGYDPTYGARPLRRALQHLVQDPLAMKLLNGEFVPGDQIRIEADLGQGKMRFEKSMDRAAPGH